MEAPPPREPLPVHILLDIVARSDDVATVAVRFAAVSKQLRRAILGTGFLRHLADRGFNPALLLGVSYAAYGGAGTVPPRPSPRLHFDANILQSSFKHMASRDGVVVLWQRPDDVRVCNTVTGRVDTLPPCIDDKHRFGNYGDMYPPALRAVVGDRNKFGNGGIYPPALLAVGRADRSFELLVMDKCLRCRIFSSKDDDGRGQWGDACFVRPPPDRDHWTMFAPDTDIAAAVIGRTVHWVCYPDPSWMPGNPLPGKFVLAVHADAAVATAIELPEGYVRTTGSSTQLLAVTADGRLSLVVAEPEVVSTWTLLPKGWSRQVVISRQRINEQVVAPGVDASRPVWFQFEQGFGEVSGTVLLWMDKVGLVQLNVRTKKVVLLRRYVEGKTNGVNRACLHEMNLYAYQPLSSRDGLLVLLGPESRREELHVCNSFTGVITTLPSMDVGPDNWENAIYYYPAILDVGRAGRDFEVLAMDQCLRTRIFSSSGGVGKWGAIRVAKAPPEYKSCGGIKQLVLHNSPAVVGRTVHWICHAKVGPAIEEEEMFVLALHADDAAQATAIEMPPGYPYIESTDMQTCTVQIAAVDGKLSVVMAESEVVSVSTRSPEGWIRQAVFRKREISRQVNGTRGFREVRFEGFGERSGTVLFWMDTVGLVRLSLDARKAVVVREYIELMDLQYAVTASSSRANTSTSNSPYLPYVVSHVQWGCPTLTGIPTERWAVKIGAAVEDKRSSSFPEYKASLVSSAKLLSMQEHIKIHKKIAQ
ncbi:hypothetical protein EJB05_04217, partial [Eragrostis curvula]